MTSYGGAPISYDAMGNPTSIDLDSLTWQGRELQSYYDGEYEISFKYNADGIRTVKDVCELAPGVTIRHSYTLSGSRIIGETVYYYVSETSQYEQYRLVYLYDETGAPIGMKYRKPSYAPNDFDYYFFEKNLQGDIIAIYDEEGTQIGTYTYDAWGNCSVNPTSGYNFILSNNPFRYRGYYYDTETGFYYLQSRYYNPQWGRFINADAYVSTGQGFVGYNMFSYCGNNPANRIDPTGEIWWIVALVTTGIVALSLTSCSSSTERGSYDSADEAALAFYGEVYSKSIDEGVEYGTEIYSHTIDGKTTYSYNKPRSGDKYGVEVGKKVPKGTEYVAYAHTHPANNNGFSPKDYALSYKWGVNMYVVGPNGKIYKYDIEKDICIKLPWAFQ